MNTLTEQFYDVMYKYRKSFGIAGVQKNLEQWKAGKKDLHALLQKHPDWNEDELAVVLHYLKSCRRQINPWTWQRANICQYDIRNEQVF